MTIWTAGTVSGAPAYPYEEVMAGEALKVTKSASTTDHLRASSSMAARSSSAGPS